MLGDENSLRSSYNRRSVFALVAAFFAIQIAFDLAHSVTAFPFVHFGMFSESFSAPDSLLRYEVIVNGRRLDPRDFRIYQWDMIQQPLAAFDRQTATHDFASDKSRVHAAFPSLYAQVSDNLSNSSYPESRFPDWYANYLSLLIGHPIRTLGVTKTWYRHENGRSILLSTTTWINH